MKILILTNSDEGLYNFRKELLLELLKENEVVLSVPKGEYFGFFRGIGCKLIPTNFERHGINLLKEFWLILKYKKMLCQEKPKIVLTYTIKPNVYGGMICAALGIPYVANITGLGTAIENGGITQKIVLVLYKVGLHKAQKVFFQNKNNYEFMAAKGVVGRNYSIIPGSGVNLRENCFEQYPSEKDGIKFLFVGRIMKDKGIEEYLHCAKKIRTSHPECSFDIVGGYDEEVYRPIVEQYEKDGIVNVFGKQSDVHSFMKSHHVLIQPSYHEGLSNVLLEAAACGRPVLASNVPGCKETFDEGISGLGFEPRNGDSLVASVEKMISLTSDEREKMGIHGRKKMENEFGRQIVIEAYLMELNRIQ